MTDSWRNILERAATNLSIELDDKPIGRPAAPSAAWSRLSRPALRPRTFDETREALGRELEAIPARSMEAPAPMIKDARRKKRPAKARQIPPSPAMMHPDLAPPQAPAKSERSNNLAALVVSVSIVALSVYAIYGLLH